MKIWLGTKYKEEFNCCEREITTIPFNTEKKAIEWLENEIKEYEVGLKKGFNETLEDVAQEDFNTVCYGSHSFEVYLDSVERFELFIYEEEIR